MATKTILLQGGTILTHDQNDHVHPLKADILIEGDLISKIEANITPPAGTQVIGCKNKIISPGFIDTHHHVWQTLLKGRHANELLLEYFYTGNLMNSMHNPEEIFWGQLGGALECLDAGTTTVVDHAHLNYSPEHSKAALAATISSGIRSIFGYCPTPRVQTWKPFTLNPNLLEDWVLTTMDELASKSPFGDGRVQIGLAFDGLFLPKEYVVALFERAKAKGIKTITSHFARTPISPTNTLQILHSYGLLDKSIIISHGSNLTAEDATVLLSSGATISSTPSTEMQMLGFPVPFYPATSPSIHSNCSLGIDCHSATSASIPSEMKLLLQGSRAAYNQLFIDQGKVPKKVNIEVEEVFNLGTIKGARAVGMEEEIGSLAVGKRADIVVFDGGSTGMVCAAEHDPVTAVVFHSSVRDVEMVIVNGIIRKERGVLKNVDLGAGKELWNVGMEKKVVDWKQISEKLVSLREGFQEKIKGLDMQEARAGVIKGFHIDESKIVDKL